MIQLLRYLSISQLLAALLVSPLFAGEDGDADAIRSVRAESNQAIARHDVEAIVSSLYKEYVITVSTGDILPGREPQAGSWSQHFDEFPDVVYVRTPSNVTVSQAYPLAIENGTWVGTMTTQNGALEKG